MVTSIPAFKHIHGVRDVSAILAGGGEALPTLDEQEAAGYNKVEIDEIYHAYPGMYSTLVGCTATEGMGDKYAELRVFIHK